MVIKNWFLRWKSYLSVVFGLFRKNIIECKGTIKDINKHIHKIDSWGSSTNDNPSAFVESNIDLQDNSITIFSYKSDLQVGKDWNGNNRTCKSSGGRIYFSNVDFKKISFDFKLDGRGWHSFWLLGHDETYKETDIYETFGKVKDGIVKMSAAKHWGDSSEKNRQVERYNYYIQNKKTTKCVIIRENGYINTHMNGCLVNTQIDNYNKPPDIIFSTKQQWEHYGDIRSTYKNIKIDV